MLICRFGKSLRTKTLDTLDIECRCIIDIRYPKLYTLFVANGDMQITDIDCKRNVTKTQVSLTTPGGDGIEAAAVVEPTVDGHDRPRPGAPNLASNLPHGQLERDLFAFRRRGEVAIEEGPRAPCQPLYTSNRNHR